MPIETIEYKGHTYPKFQSEGNAMKFALPFAQQVCVGYGCDVGCNRREWVYEDKNGVKALAIDLLMEDGYHALNLPAGKFDYLISSHMLEHVPDWVDVLDYWKTKLKPGGVLFLYLPHPGQEYWLPWNNRKHIHSFCPQFIGEYLLDRKWENIFVGSGDLNGSFMVMAENQ